MIAALDIPKAAVLGKHARYTASDWGRKKSHDHVQRRLGTGTAEFAGETHRLWQVSTPGAEFNCGGSRPFSWGEVWKMPILRAVLE